MEDLYRCPDCNAEHQEPEHAGLGYLVRCLECAWLIELVEFERLAAEAPIFEIRVAA